MPRWTPDDIPWDQFDRSKLDADLLALVKAAGLTEYNSGHYTKYLRNVFHGDAEFQAIVGDWQLEEEQHGRMLGRYAELADPGYDFEATFKAFTEGYVIPIDMQESIRGSRVGELQSRCIVETGTSSFYSAMAEATEEPVLREICRRIAADEFRHYRLFLDGVKKYQELEKVSFLSRLRVTIDRLKETEDDELAFAYHCGNEPGLAYDHGRCNSAYAARAYRMYGFHHAQRAVGMIFKATGLKPHGWLGRKVTDWAWKKMQSRTRALQQAA
ncbi:MAG TPA: ferritin-like domain-containing protein [Candidatus Sulfotelmatobacter sp.]|jgi:rubrerythrin|nr:ferritin-like domain-containing protein [Candidatus Sulfotelmatobacter sp.]